MNDFEILNRDNDQPLLPIFNSAAGWRQFSHDLKAERKKIGFVPTMGALHAGHHTLVRRALAENDFVLVSIFVNPTQFNNKEDLKLYPRDLKGDIKGLATLSANSNIGVFVPDANEMYADQYRYQVTENQKSKILCGAYRPGHFDGVLTVVMKLLQIAQADRCYMGEKDYQQYLLVREMAENFFLQTEIIPCLIVREPSGLAMSSRNERLSRQARERAALIYKLLRESVTLEQRVLSEVASADHQAIDLIRDTLEKENFIVDYVEDHWGRRFVAASIENVRLIDNIEINREVLK